MIQMKATAVESETPVANKECCLVLQHKTIINYFFIGC